METKISHLIVLDLDGTSVRYEPCLEMDPDLIAYLRSVRDSGVRWVINSDRYTETLIEIAEKLSSIDRPIAILSLQRFMSLLNGGNEYRSCDEWNNAQINKHNILWKQISPYFDEWKEQVEKKINILDKVINDIVFAYMVPTENIKELRQMMMDFLAPFSEANVSGNHDWSYMLHNSFSKAAVLSDLAARLGVEKDKIIAIGDGLNDISMLNGSVTESVGCPANASAEVAAAVKKAGGIISSKESAAGTLEIIKEYLEI